jgi:hypothetical protein
MSEAQYLEMLALGVALSAELALEVELLAVPSHDGEPPEWVFLGRGKFEKRRGVSINLWFPTAAPRINNPRLWGANLCPHPQQTG